jgi:sugar lactone lactonase YvrE
MRPAASLRAVSLAAMLAVSIAGCGRGAAPLASASTSPAGVPNPFTIVARYSASSLGLRHPVALSVGPGGDLYITDTAPSVTEVSTEGNVLRRWGQRGKGTGEFSFPMCCPGDTAPEVPDASITVGPDGKVYVSDSGNARVQVFSPTGGFVRDFGGPGVSDGQFLMPFDLAVDADGNVYVVDDSLRELQKFSPSGRFLWEVGAGSDSDPRLSGYFNLADVDSHGRVVLAVNETGYVAYLDASGHLVDSFSLASLPVPSATGRIAPCQATVNGLGDTVVGSCPLGPQAYHDMLLFDRDHRLIGAWYHSPIREVFSRFGPNDELFAIGQDGSILKLKVSLPGA